MENEKVTPGPSLRAAQMSTMAARFAVHTWMMRHFAGERLSDLGIATPYSVNALPVNAS
jgi:hypothetical protein